MRSDSRQAYVGVLDKNGAEISTRKWEAGRELSAQILQTLSDLLDSTDKSLADLTGIIVYEGPGSYTGLRISISVGNALAYSQSIAIVGVTGGDWLQKGISSLQNGTIGAYIAPEYGGEVHTTKPRK